MKWTTSPVVFVLAFAFIATLAAATSGSSSSVDDDSLVAELIEWKISPAGQEAQRLGYVPPSSSPGPSITGWPDYTDEELARFQASKTIVEDLRRKQPQATFTLNTPFALMTTGEFAQFVNKSNVVERRKLLEQTLHGSTDGAIRERMEAGSRSLRQQQDPAPPAVDWQQYGCVTRVKDQGQCGVCWVFAAIGAMEAGYCISTGSSKTLYELSEQDMVSCSSLNGACNSGWSRMAYDWMIFYNGGTTCSEASLPYTSSAGSGPTCQRYDDSSVSCSKPDIGLVSYVSGQYPDHTQLEKVVARRPVASQVKAGVPYFQFYSGGVLKGDDNQCPSNWGDHEVTIVGYGERDGTPYWKIKNSWGVYWGEQGYIYLERGFQGATFGACGIENWAYYPVFRSQAPATEELRCQEVRYGTELLGDDLKNETTYSYDNCCDVCRREPGCKGYNFRYDGTFTCRLKATIEGETFDESYLTQWNSGKIITKEDAALQCLPVEDNVDYYGNDIIRALAPTVGDCCDMCTRTPSCNAYTWTKFHDGSCYLKYDKGNNIQLHTPLPDGSAYFRSGEIYRCQPLQTNVDFPGEDFKSIQAPHAGDCCTLCRTNYPCKAFSWSNYQGGTCWLKTKKTSSIENTGVISATLN